MIIHNNSVRKIHSDSLILFCVTSTSCSWVPLLSANIAKHWRFIFINILFISCSSHRSYVIGILGPEVHGSTVWIILPEGGQLAQSWRCHFGFLLPVSECLGWSSSFTLDFSLLWMHSLGVWWWWLKWLSPCPHCSWLQRGPVLAISITWRVNQWMGDLFSFLHFHSIFLLFK